MGQVNWLEINEQCSVLSSAVHGYRKEPNVAGVIFLKRDWLMLSQHLWKRLWMLFRGYVKKSGNSPPMDTSGFLLGWIHKVFFSCTNTSILPAPTVPAASLRRLHQSFVAKIWFGWCFVLKDRSWPAFGRVSACASRHAHVGDVAEREISLPLGGWKNNFR